MQERCDLSRITIDIPKDSHKRLKALAAMMGKSMREVILESIQKKLDTAILPNKKTQKAIADTQKKRGLVKAKNANDLFKKLGI